MAHARYQQDALIVSSTPTALDAYQMAVVAHRPEDGNMTVAAGAGSGKTTTLVALVASLIQRGYPASRITVTTFTAKAGEHILHKLRDRLGMMVDQVQIGTFNALALRHLRSFEGWRWSQDKCLDVPPGINGVMTNKLWRSVTGFRQVPGLEHRHGLDIKFPDGTTAFDYAQFANKLASRMLFPNMKVTGDTSLGALAGLPNFDRAWSLFDEAKKSMHGWLFSDTLSRWRHCLRNDYEDIPGPRGINGTVAPKMIDNVIVDAPEMGEVAGVFPLDLTRGRIVIVDEAQDSTKVQIDIARRLASPYGRVFLVGDSRQAIYRFTGAYVEFFADSVKVLQSKVYSLAVNYRSSTRIVAVGNAIADTMPDRFGDPSIAASQDSGHVFATCYETPDDECVQVARAISERVRAGAAPTAFGVIHRTNGGVARMALHLAALGVPFRTAAGKGLLEQHGVIDFLSWMAALSNPNAPVPAPTMQAILNHARFLKREWKDQLITLGSAQGLQGALQALLAARGKADPRQHDIVQGLEVTVGELVRLPFQQLAMAIVDILAPAPQPKEGKRKKKEIPASTAAQAAAEALGVIGGTTADDGDGASRGILLACAAGTRIHADWPSYFRAIVQIPVWQADETLPAVLVSTGHGIKGLERDVIYAIGLSKGILPSPNSRSEADFAEERRLFYVMATRPRHELQLSWSETIYRTGGLVDSGASPMLIEAADRLLDLRHRWILDTDLCPLLDQEKVAALWCTDEEPEVPSQVPAVPALPVGPALPTAPEVSTTHTAAGLIVLTAGLRGVVAAAAGPGGVASVVQGVTAAAATILPAVLPGLPNLDLPSRPPTAPAPAAAVLPPIPTASGLPPLPANISGLPQHNAPTQLPGLPGRPTPR